MTLARWRHRLAWSLATRPRLYLPLARLGLRVSSRMRGRAVVPTTEIVIEGFPRCANTFSVAAFRHAQGRDVEIAHHLHSPAQVLAAVRWKVPTLLLIREPVAAAASYAARNRELTPSMILDEYRRFYDLLLPVREQVVVADFDEVVRDFGAVVQRVNERYATDFVPFEHTGENVRHCFRAPSIGARQRKEEHLATLASPELAAAVAAARDTYASFVASPTPSSRRIHAPCA